MPIPDEILENVARCFNVLGEPTRLKIFRSVCHGEKCVTDIVTEVGSSQTNISRHLGVMYHSGILARQRNGSQMFYSVADPVFIEVCRTLCMKFIVADDRAAA